ncbi:hypothetical protein KAU11_11935 [Candidatus Babeliales bacterium]|nr:hypothetical protein [Candidatus Babeliales bacterium]
MPKTQATKDYNTFIRGIITEANALTYPENASIDEANFILNKDGSRQRRLGMDYEADYALSTDNFLNSTFQDHAVTVHEWRNADNSGLYNFSVVQVGTTLRFFDLSEASISSNLKSFTVDLTAYKTSYALNIGSEPISGTTGKGVFYVSSKDTEPFYIEYDSDLDTISVTQITILKRDFLGTDDTLTTNNRPSTLSSAHSYNLLNQGWTETNYDAYFTSKAVYPSNSDIWTIAKDSNDDFDPDLLDKKYFGNTPAPKGHYILEAFYRIRSAGVSIEAEENRPNSVAFYAGRVFYAGVESSVKRLGAPATVAGETINGDIYFSQILTDNAKAGNCYQDADPTSEEISDLLPDDGGVITIPEVGRVLKIEALYDSLILFADNGVWQIKGDSDSGFTAIGYQVQKITSIGAVGAGAIVSAENNIFFWSTSGIYTLSPDNISGLLSAQNITETTIQTLFNDIPSVSKQYAQGFYDVTSKRISWLYNEDDSYDGASFKYKYNKELILDIVLSAFYKNTISSLASDTPYVAGAVTTPSLLVTDVAYNVVHDGNQVQANSVDVQVSLPNPSRGTVSTKYLTVVPQDATNSKITWSLYNNTTFIDWEISDSVGVDYTSFLRTGYELFGDSMRQKAAPYVIAHFQRTETGFVLNGNGGLDAENPSGCLLQARWDWSDSSTSGRWSTPIQAYRMKRNYIPTGIGDAFDYGFEVVSTKNKLRGKGRSLGFYFESQAGNDMHLLGWSVSATGETVV